MEVDGTIMRLHGLTDRALRRVARAVASDDRPSGLEDWWRSVKFYHGTDYNLPEGDFIIPAHLSDDTRDFMEEEYGITDFEGGWFLADFIDHARNYGRHIYEVFPDAEPFMIDNGIYILEQGSKVKIKKVKTKVSGVVRAVVGQGGGITWTMPDFEEELGEYFENAYTKEAFKEHGFYFSYDEDLLDFLKTGSLVDITKEELSTNYDNITIKGFEDELKDEEYAGSYNSMQSELEEGLTLPAPIVIKFGSLYYGFAGNRRMNLAWNNDVPLKVWLVEAVQEEVPEIGYHVSSRSNRESIQKNGLRPDPMYSEDTGYVWFFDSLDEAISKVGGNWSSTSKNDIWELDVSGLNVQRDPHPGWQGVKSWVVIGKVSPDRIRLVEEKDN